MDVDLTPAQPEPVERAIAEILEQAAPEGAAGVDPWWRAGIDEALET